MYVTLGHGYSYWACRGWLYSSGLWTKEKSWDISWDVLPMFRVTCVDFFLSFRAGAFHGRDVMYVRPMGRDRWVYIFITDKVHTSWYCHKQMIPSHVRSTLPMRPPLQISVDAAHPKVRIFLSIAFNSRLSHHLHSLGRHLANHRVLLLCGGNHSRYRCLQGAYYFATRLH